MSDGKIVEEGTVKELFEHPKHEVTKKFVQNINADQPIEELAEQLKSKYPDGPLLRVSFTGNNTDQPVIADCIRKVTFPVSVVQSDISQSVTGPIGVTYLHLYHGSDDQYNLFVTELTSYDGVKVEVL